jgi:hypothetical protein
MKEKMIDSTPSKSLLQRNEEDSLIPSPRCIEIVLGAESDILFEVDHHDLIIVSSSPSILGIKRGDM